MVAQSDISILIPAYGQPLLTEQAIECALATQAGEILVSDDAGGLSIAELGSKYTDNRIKFFSQSSNIGLWKNHLYLLKKASKSWVKFLQTDDSFSTEAFAHLASKADSTVSLVAMEPSYKDLETGEVSLSNKVKEDALYATEVAVSLFSKRGNYPGRPSYCLYNKSLMNLDEAFWNNEISADLAQNIWLASKGNVVITPNKGLTCGVHTAQDGKNQTSRLILSRLRNSYKLLTEQLESKEFKSVRSYFLAEFALLSKLALTSFFKNAGVSIMHLLSTTKQFVFSLVNPKVLSGATAYTKYKLGKQ